MDKIQTNMPNNPNLPTLKNGAVFIADSHFRASLDLGVDFAKPSLDFQNPKSSAKTKNFSPKSSLDFSQNMQQNIQKDSADFNVDFMFLRTLDSLIASPPPQVFLMGDIADLFIGHIPSSARQNRFLIQKINALSQKCEVFYFEGNHDFGIDSSLLPNVKIYPRILQPALFDFGGKIYALAHGDIFLDKGYEIYIRAINCAFVLSGLKILNFLSFGKIYDFASAKVHKKRVRHLDFSQADFYEFAKNRTQKYINAFAKSSKNGDISKIKNNKIDENNGISGISGIIEGHFHIGQSAHIKNTLAKKINNAKKTTNAKSEAKSNAQSKDSTNSTALESMQNLQNATQGDLQTSAQNALQDFAKDTLHYISLPSFFCDKEIFTLL